MTAGMHYPLLDTVHDTEPLRALPEAQLPQLADELRRILIDSEGRTGGHLAANHGVVELTVALHYVYHTPADRLVWDVGHQSYPHKILTGRRERMPTLRQKNGLAGFPKRSESPYDAFGVGHSRTSVSAALGMAIAAEKQGAERKVVAVIGDGALTAGMAFEALNHAGDLHTDLLLILIVNDMSISPNVGGLSNHLARILSGKLYVGLREQGKKALKNMPPVWELARRAEEYVMGMVVPGTLFEELGFNYIGPVDGHDLPTLVKTLRNLRGLKGPQFLHVVTKKGKGYKPAEDNPCGYHGVGAFDPLTGTLNAGKSGTPSYTDVFGDWVCDMAAQDPRLVAITPAMREGSGLVNYSERFPTRYFDVGIAEQHAVTLAAGLRSVDPRRRDTEPAGAVRDRSRRRGRPGRADARRQFRPQLSALRAQYGRDDAGRRERVPADALHGLSIESARRRALSARRRARRARAKGQDRAARRQGRRVAQRPPRCKPRLRQRGASGAASRRHARYHRGEHALREADRRGPRPAHGGDARAHRHCRGKRSDGRRGRRGQRMSRGTGHRRDADPPRSTRCLCRARQPCRAAARGRTHRRRHRRAHQGSFRARGLSRPARADQFLLTFRCITH